MLRISTVVDSKSITLSDMPLEVLRISTVVDIYHHHAAIVAFGSAKNFYCCRFMLSALRNDSFGSAKNFYCCRSNHAHEPAYQPLEVLRISTVVDPEDD